MRIFYRFTLTVLLFCVVVPSVEAQQSPKPETQTTEPLDIDRFFANSVVIDGNVNYFSPSGLGQPDFRDVKARTGIDFGGDYAQIG